MPWKSPNAYNLGPDSRRAWTRAFDINTHFDSIQTHCHIGPKLFLTEVKVISPQSQISHFVFRMHFRLKINILLAVESCICILETTFFVVFVYAFVCVYVSA